MDPTAVDEDGSGGQLTKAADNCLEAFQSLLDFSESPRWPLETAQVVDELEQLRYWARNLGVFATGRASLDHRLKDSDAARDAILAILGSMRSNIEQCTTMISSKEEVTSPENPHAQHQSDAFNPLSSNPTGLENSLVNTMHSTGSGGQMRREQVRLLFKDVQEAGDRLVKFAVIIRSGASRRRVVKGSSYEELDEDGHPVSAARDEVLRSILHRDFADISPSLLSRLVQAVGQRRRQFAYSRAHQKRIAYGNIWGSSYETASKHQQSMREHQQKQKLFHLEQLALPGEFTIPLRPALIVDNSKTVWSKTSASSYRDHPQLPKASSSITRSSRNSQAVLGDSVLPPPPETGGKRFFECPCCCILLPAQQAEIKAWRKHLKQDLQAYVCIYDDCPDAVVSYESRIEWLEHLESSHNNEWCCDGFTHPPEVFKTAGAFQEHMRTTHAGVFSELQIRKLTARSKMPPAVLFECCPFCSYMPMSRAISRDLGNEDENRLRSLDKTEAEYQTHIEAHMIEIFLHALPPELTEQELQSSGRKTLGSHTVLSLSEGSEDEPFQEDPTEQSRVEMDDPYIPDTISLDIWKEIIPLEYDDQSANDPILLHFSSIQSVAAESLETLKFPGMLMEIPSKRTGVETMRDHLFNDSVFTDWCHDDQPVLCLKGSAASGKSTLMAYLANTFLPLVPNLSSKLSQGYFIAAFAFSTSAPETSNMIRGLYLSLIHQICRAHPKAARHAAEVIDQKGLGSAILFQLLIDSVVSLAEEDTSCCILIDAIGQCEQIDELYNAIENLSLRKGMKIILTCEYETLSTELLRLQHRPSVEMERLNTVLLRNIADSGMTKLGLQCEESDNQGRTTLLFCIDELAIRARGSFAWMDLALLSIAINVHEDARGPGLLQNITQMLNETAVTPSEMHLRRLHLRSHVTSLPQNLSQLFTEVFVSSKHGYESGQRQNALFLMLYDFAPLSVELTVKDIVYAIDKHARCTDDKAKETLATLLGNIVEFIPGKDQRRYELAVHFTHDAYKRLLRVERFWSYIEIDPHTALVGSFLRQMDLYLESPGTRRDRSRTMCLLLTEKCFQHLSVSIESSQKLSIQLNSNCRASIPKLLETLQTNLKRLSNLMNDPLASRAKTTQWTWLNEHTMLTVVVLAYYNGLQDYLGDLLWGIPVQDLYHLLDFLLRPKVSFEERPYFLPELNDCVPQRDSIPDIDQLRPLLNHLQKLRHLFSRAAFVSDITLTTVASSFSEYLLQHEREIKSWAPRREAWLLVVLTLVQNKWNPTYHWEQYEEEEFSKLQETVFNVFDQDEERLVLMQAFDKLHNELRNPRDTDIEENQRPFHRTGEGV